METQADKSSVTLVWIAAILLIVFCGAGVVALMGWIPASFSVREEPVLTKLTLPAARTPATVASACAGCGVVKSVRKVKVAAKRKVPGRVPAPITETEERAQSGISYEVTVRLDDGTNRVIDAVDTPPWRFGDKVRIVDGVIQSDPQSPA